MDGGANSGKIVLVLGMIGTVAGSYDVVLVVNSGQWQFLGTRLWQWRKVQQTIDSQTADGDFEDGDRLNSTLERSHTRISPGNLMRKVIGV
jgi:hypothetical protein